MNEQEAQQQLHSRLAEAERLATQYRKALRRDLLIWIVIAAALGALLGYGVAAALIDPVTVILPCDEGVKA
jgi:hypothetical protein